MVILRKKIVKCILIGVYSIVIIGCSFPREDIFKAEMKNEELIMTYQIRIEDNTVIESESESIFHYKNSEYHLYKNHLDMLMSSLDYLNTRSGTYTNIASDDKEQKIIIKTIIHFKDVKPDEISDLFGSDYKSLLNESRFPEWSKVKKSLEEMGLKVTRV